MCFYESLDLLKDRGNVLEKKKVRVRLLIIIAKRGPCGGIENLSESC